MRYKKASFIIILILFTKCALAQQAVHISNEDTVAGSSSMIQNAVYDEIVCRIDGAEFLEYLIYDQSGKELKQGWFLNNVQVKYLEPGTYTLVVNYNDIKIKKEFLKLKNENVAIKQDDIMQ